MSDETVVETEKTNWGLFAQAVLELAGKHKLIGLALGGVEVKGEKELQLNAFAILPGVADAPEGPADFRRLAQSVSFQIQESIFRETENKLAPAPAKAEEAAE